jgi:hypothetical protein
LSENKFCSLALDAGGTVASSTTGSIIKFFDFLDIRSHDTLKDKLSDTVTLLDCRK